MKVLELKNTLEIKRLVNGLKSRIEKIKKWTGKQTYTNLKEREETKWRVSGICSTVTNYPIFVSSGSRKKKTEGRFEKVLNDTMNENILKVAKNINLQLQEREQIPISYKPKEILANTENLSWTDLLWKNTLRNLSR